jgi:hypothetical protein
MNQIGYGLYLELVVQEPKKINRFCMRCQVAVCPDCFRPWHEENDLPLAPTMTEENDLLPAPTVTEENDQLSDPTVTEENEIFIEEV